ncbi:zinc-ribbon domain-containing protein [bacterium]|nr:zinc-ribbon domain-containing protein [bacterium]
MEQEQKDIWLRIQCPKCESRYRIERNKIPAEGATVQCKKCGARLVLRLTPAKRPQGPSGAEPAAKNVPGQRPAAAQPAGPADNKCPKCGFFQPRGEFCYKCGTRMRIIPKKPKPQDPDKSGDWLPVGLIHIDMGYKSSLFFMSLVKPVIEIDSEQYVRSWGREQFQVPSGRYRITVYGLLAGKRIGESTQIVEVQKDDYIQLQYMMDSANHADFLLLKKESDAPWRSLIQRSEIKERDPIYLKPYPVLFALMIFYPIGAYFLYKTRHFTSMNKWIIGAVALAAYLYIIAKTNFFAF